MSKEFIPTSAQTAKERLLNIKSSDLPPTHVGDEPPKGFEPPVALSVSETLAQRGSRYGDFTDHARLCQNLMEELRMFTKPAEEFQSHYIPWDELPAIHKQALTVIMDKVARILSGDPNYDDNWHDIQGYAKLVEDRLPCNKMKES